MQLAISYPKIRRLTLFAFSLLLAFPVFAQSKEFHQSVGAAYTSFRFEPGHQYFGLGLDYRYFPRSWLGIEVQAGGSLNQQVNFTGEDGYESGQISGSALLGRRWGKVKVLSEDGFGVTSNRVNYGLVDGQSTTTTRQFPTLLVGGMLDISISKRWSVVYEIRDDVTFIAPYSLHGLPGAGTYPAQTLNVPDTRIGLDFHF